MDTEKRIISIDIMKGLLIIFVVLGHSNWEYRKVIYWFHMPLFFMISGYLLRVPIKENEKEWIVRKCKTILVPYCAYAFIMGLLKIPYGYKSVVSYWFRCIYGGEVASGVYWFITVLLLSEIIVVLLCNRIQKQRRLNIIFLVMYMLATVESILFIPPNTIHVPIFTKLPWNFDVCLIAAPFVFFGYNLNQYRENIKSFLNSKWCNVTVVVVDVLLVFILALTDAYTCFTLDMKYSQYKALILDVACPIAVGFSLWLFSNTISHTRGGYF